MDAVTRLLEALPIKEHPVSIPARSFDAFTNPSQCSSAVTTLDLKCQPIIKDARGKTHFIAVNSVMQMIIEAENEVLVTSPAGIASPQLGTSLQSEKSNLLTDTDFKEFKGLEYTNVPHRIDIGEREAVRVCKSGSSLQCGRNLFTYFTFQSVYFELATKFYPMFDEEIFMARVRATYTNPETLNDTAWFVTFSLILLYGYLMESAHQEHARAWHVQQIGNAAWKVLGTYPYWPTSLLKVQALVTGVSTIVSMGDNASYFCRLCTHRNLHDRVLCGRWSPRRVESHLPLACKEIAVRIFPCLQQKDEIAKPRFGKSTSSTESSVSTLERHARSQNTRSTYPCPHILDQLGCLA